MRTENRENRFSISDINKTNHLLNKLYQLNFTVFDKFIVWEKVNHYDYLNTSLPQLTSQLVGIALDNPQSVESFARIESNADAITFCMRQNFDQLDRISNGEYNRALKLTIGRIQTVQAFMEGFKSRVLEQYINKIFPFDADPQPEPGTVESILYQGKMSEILDPFRVIILMDNDIVARTTYGNLLKKKITQKKLDLFQYDFRLYQTLIRLKIE